MRHDSYSSEYLSPPVKRQRDLKYRLAKASYRLKETAKRIENLKKKKKNRMSYDTQDLVNIRAIEYTLRDEKCRHSIKHILRLS